MPAGTGLISGGGERELAAFTDAGWSVRPAVVSPEDGAGGAPLYTS